MGNKLDWTKANIVHKSVKPVSKRTQKSMNKWVQSKPIRQVHIDEVLTFGTWRGYTPRQLMESEPDYIENCLKARTFTIIEGEV